MYCSVQYMEGICTVVYSIRKEYVLQCIVYGRNMYSSVQYMEGICTVVYSIRKEYVLQCIQYKEGICTVVYIVYIWALCKFVSKNIYTTLCNIRAIWSLCAMCIRVHRYKVFRAVNKETSCQNRTQFKSSLDLITAIQL